MELPILYEDEYTLVIDKPAGITVFSEKNSEKKTLIDHLLDKYPWMRNAGSPPRYGIVHRLDKDTSGVLLAAKNNEALDFLQNQFKKRLVEKKYLTLVIGRVKDNKGIIETLIGRSPKDKRKQKIYLIGSPESRKRGLRKTKTYWKVIEVFSNDTNDYTLLEVCPKTGRKHQIRTHLAFLGHPIVGDKLYSFKNQPIPKGLTRQFLHASYLKIKLLNGKEKEFKSELPKELKEVLKNINKGDKKYDN